MRILRVFSLLFVLGLAHAQTSTQVSPDPADGNLIPEPELKDYQAAHRTPGILYEPYDVVDQNGKAIDF